MKLRILSWNVREVNYGDKQKNFKSLIKSQRERADLVCLQETKVQKMMTWLMRSLRVGKFLD